MYPSLNSPGVEISYLSLPGTEDPRHGLPRHRSDPGHPGPPPQFDLKIVFILISFLTRITVNGNAIKRWELFNLYYIEIPRDCYLKGTENYFYCSHLSEI